MSINNLRISPTPSNTPSNTPSITPSSTECPKVIIYGAYSTNGCGSASLSGYTSFIRYEGVDYALTGQSISGSYEFGTCMTVQYPFVGYTYQFDLILDPTLIPCDAGYGYTYDRLDYEVVSYNNSILPIVAFNVIERYYLSGVLVDTIPSIITIVNQVIQFCNVNVGGLVPQFRVQSAFTPTPSPTNTQTITPTPSPTFCYQPKAYLVLDAQSGNTALNTWMLSQGSSFRGLWINSPSSTQSVFEAQMNAYISYTGFGTTTFYIEDEPIVSTTSLTHSPEQLFFGTNVWNTWFVPTCPFCEGGNWTTWNGATLTAAQYNKPFYYSGTAIPQGYYRWLTTYTNTGQRLSIQIEQTLDNLVCPATPTPTPTLTETPTPSITQTQTPSITPSISSTTTQTNTPSVSPTNTETPTLTPTPSETSPGGQLFIYARYIGSTQEVGYTINSGSYLGIGDPTSSCNYMTTISGLQINDVIDFMTIGTCAIGGDTTTCPAGTSGCNYQHTFNGTTYIYLTIDASNCC